jgi:hypothetical protein
VDNPELILQDNDEEGTGESESELGAVWTVGAVAAGVVLVAGVVVFIVGVRKWRNAYSPQNEEADTTALTRTSQGAGSGGPMYGTRTSNIDL